MAKEEQEGKHTIEEHYLGEFKDILIREAHDDVRKDTTNNGDEFGMDFPDISEITGYSKAQSEISADIMDLFPDISSATNIIKSVVLNGSFGVNLKHVYPSSVSNALVTKLKEIFVDKHNLDENAGDILEEALVTKGAAAYLMVGFNELKRLTNKTTMVATESDLSEVAITETKLFPSAVSSSLNFTISDNLSVIDAGKELINKEVSVVNSLVTVANESDMAIMDEIDSMFRKIEPSKSSTVLTLEEDT